MPHLTPTQLAGHLACPHLTQLERLQRGGTLQVEFAPDPRLEALRERGRQHEAAYVDALSIETARGLARLPEPSPGDIFLDFEGDPFVAPHGLEYLTGYCFDGDDSAPVLTQH